MIEIGYCFSVSPELMLDEDVQPRRVNPSDMHVVEAEGQKSFLKCPAIQSYIKNSFVVPCPFSSTIKLNEKPQFNSDKVFWTGDEFKWDECFELLTNTVYFFTDAPNVTAVLTPHKDSPFGSAVIRAVWSVSQYPRGVHSALFGVKAGDTFTLRKGDPDYVVTFTVPYGEQVKLVPCNLPKSHDSELKAERFFVRYENRAWAKYFKRAALFREKIF